jgi:hypothetical protein
MQFNHIFTTIKKGIMDGFNSTLFILALLIAHWVPVIKIKYF